MSALRVEGYFLSYLLECSGLARSTYYYALAHPVKPTRPELHHAVAEIFSRTTNGCGHRQIAMCLRAELGVRMNCLPFLMSKQWETVHCAGDYDSAAC